jgi:ssDNA thymidine ADP-ribosyltransferase, DarT
MPVPAQPKIYHIVHVDRLASIIADGSLWSDAVMVQRQGAGTTIGMSNIKARRLNELSLSCYPDLRVGHCTPFYFCPRSVMLYLIYRRNEELAYKGGQEPIVHLEADLHAAIAWAQQNDQRWAFTLSNAGAYYFEDRSDVANLSDINWDAVQSRQWSGNGVSRSVKEGKQAEFLIERSFPWHLVERIGVHSQGIVSLVANGIQGAAHRPQIEIRRDWYY